MKPMPVDEFMKANGKLMWFADHVTKAPTAIRAIPSSEDDDHEDDE